MRQLNKKPKSSRGTRGKKLCPDCRLESGTRTSGQCKGTMADGTTPCTHIWPKTIPKKDQEIAKLKAELAACGGGDDARLMEENVRLMAENARLMAENTRLRSEHNGENFLDGLFLDGLDSGCLDSGLDGPLSPTLSLGDMEKSRTHVSPVSPRSSSLSRGRIRSSSLNRSSSLDNASCDIDDMLKLLHEPVPPLSETTPKNDVLAGMADILFQLSKLSHDQQDDAITTFQNTLDRFERA